ncbi:MAG: hypothetical protein IKW37_05940 [Bacteroidaceae bacterium]|nr:hypothetical protein [Bacteroidaceae bacterium]
MKQRTVILGIGVLIALAVSGIYGMRLYGNYCRQVAEWNEVAKTTFDEALWIEVNKRSSISFYHASSSSGGMTTLQKRIPDTVRVMTPMGFRKFKIDRYKYDHSLIQETERRGLVGALLFISPLSVDTLAMRWDSLLVSNQVLAGNRIRYIYTDEDLQNDTAFAARKGRVADSLTVRYLGFRCEHELVGYVSYPFWLSLLSLSEWGFLMLPWCVWGLLFAFYVPMERFVRKKFVHEKVVEKEVHVADVPIEKAKIYQLPDGTVFDTFAGTLIRGEGKTSLSPQSVNLLKLFVRTSDYRATAEEIDSHLWNGKGSKEQLRNAISRLRKEMKAVLSTMTIQNEGGIYELKNPHSIEENR